MKEQRSFIVTKSSNSDNITSLNELLKEGWTVINSSPMGGASLNANKSASSFIFASLVILEKPIK